MEGHMKHAKTYLMATALFIGLLVTAEFIGIVGYFCLTSPEFLNEITKYLL